MPAFTLGRLAKLYGFHRSSVYEAVAKGRVSAGLDGNGQRVIDLSEAIRVWGEPPTSPTPLPDTPPAAGARHPTPPPAILSELLEELRQIRAAQEAERDQNQRLREEVSGLKEEIAGLRVALLEHKPDKPPAGKERPAAEKAERKAEKAQSFADLLASLGD